MATKEPPAEVAKIRARIREFFDQQDPEGRKIGSAKSGVYAFFDYDGEPIYVGQTVESLSGRVGRHLTGRRSDAVAKFVLDPFEVLEIEVWPLPDAAALPPAERKALVDAVEHTVYEKALAESEFHAVLNEKLPPPGVPTVELPPSYRGTIIPNELRADRDHPDVRLARRSRTMASLAQLISERKVDKGLRNVLRVQSRRVEWLASRRFADFEAEPDEIEEGEEDAE